MDPISYIIHLIEQGKTPSEAREHARLRFGLSHEAIDARVSEARDAAGSLLRLTDPIDPRWEARRSGA